MTSITDPNMSDRFTSSMEEIHNKHLKTYADIIDTTAELSQSNRQFVKSALDTCLKKCKDDDKLFETIQAFKRDLEQKSRTLKEKRHTISEVMSEVQEKEMQKEDIIQKIGNLKEEQIKRRELIESQNKANKDRLKNLQKARFVFQDHLGLEIRTILGKTTLVKGVSNFQKGPCGCRFSLQPSRNTPDSTHLTKSSGEKLQFVFRNINPSDQDSAYVITMGIKEDGSYQIVSSDPVLDCLPVLERRLQETNNLPAFLANVRKEFISLARH